MGNKCKKPRIVIGAGFIFNFVFPASGYACANTGVTTNLAKQTAALPFHKPRRFSCVQSGY